MRPGSPARWPVLAVQGLLPLLAACLVAGVTIPGSTLWPWNPNMIDLDVYRRTGAVLLAGGDIYRAEGLPWIYPGFAALFTVPLSWPPLGLARLLWLAASVAALAAIWHRLGLTGWRLSLATAATAVLVEPVRETLGFGQLGILLCAAAVVDALPGPRLLTRPDGRRWLPEGWLVGVATAVKLVPAVVAMHQFFAGRRRAGLVAFGSFCLATLVGWLILPRETLYYWVNLAGGDSGINGGMIFKTNQSVMGAWARLTGSVSGGGLVLAGLVLVAGVAASVAVHRAGRERLGVALAGLTSLLASPISWSHHFVWVVPLGWLVATERELPRWWRALGLAYTAWVAVGPFQWLPGGDGAELRYGVGEHLVANGGVVAGLVLLVTSVWAVRARWSADEPVGAVPD